MHRRPRPTPLLAALLASGLGTACRRHPPVPPTPHPVRTITTSLPARALPGADREAAPAPAATTFVVVERVATSSPHLDHAGVTRITALVTRLLGGAGLVTEWPAPLPTSAELTAARCRGMIAVPAVHRVEVMTSGLQTRIECLVSIRIAPWDGIDGGERWEPHRTATATGTARALTSSAPRQVELGIRDCLDDAVEAVITRRLASFLVIALR